MIVDCHTHWGAEWQERDGLEPMRWLREFDRHGVTHAIVLPHLGLIDAGNIPSDNDAVATVCASRKDVCSRSVRLTSGSLKPP